jgi:hypothetical protein
MLRSQASSVGGHQPDGYVELKCDIDESGKCMIKQENQMTNARDPFTMDLRGYIVFRELKSVNELESAEIDAFYICGQEIR